MRIWADDVGVHLSWQPWTRRRKLASLAAIAAYAGAVAVLFSGAGMLTRGATLVTWEVMLVLALFVAGAIALSVTYHSRPPLPRRPDYALIASMEREVWGETFRHDGSPVAAPLELARDANGRTPAQARIEARPYACESCGAPEGEDCRTAGGRLATWPHPVLVTVCCCAKCRELDWRQR